MARLSPRSGLLSAAALAIVIAAAPHARAQSPCCDPWTDLGQGLAGAHGVPAFEAIGSLADNTHVTFALSGALENSQCWLVFGLTQLGAPFKGGTLVPSPDVVLPLGTDGVGGFELGVTWPVGLPVGTNVLLQTWIKDAAGVVGFSASNAMKGVTPPSPPAGLFPADWINGSACATDPKIQVHQYDTNTWILRQSKCVNFEGPFVFLLFGQNQVLLLDTGAAGNPPMYTTVMSVIAQWAAAHGVPAPPLIVGHTHSHGDHIANDSQFIGKPGVQAVAGTTLAGVQSFWGFSSQLWPNQVVQHDLGGRVLDVLAIPGHHPTHIAIYDHETALLLTGDTLYPGHLFISDLAAYKLSAKRLSDFMEDKPISWVWGNHVEMTSTPFVAYPYPSSSQPNERDPQLTRSIFLEWKTAVALKVGTADEVHADFILEP